MTSGHQQKAPSFKGYRSSSTRASKALAGSRATDTKCERVLRRALWHMGCRYRKNVADLPGKPDIVFPRERVAVFCDGDFWHGRNWRERRQRLSEGSNPSYWTQKIAANMRRDQRQTAELQANGWLVLRLWETDIRSDTTRAATVVVEAVASRRNKVQA